MIDYIVNNSSAIFGAILLACFTAYLGWRHWVKVRLIQAKDDFKQRVHIVFKGLYPIPTDWPEDSSAINYVLKSVFNDLQIAVSDFRHFLPKRERTAFDKAWFVYRVGEDGREIDQQCYHQYMGFQIVGEPFKDPKQVFHENVSHLLSFANKT